MFGCPLAVLLVIHLDEGRNFAGATDSVSVGEFIISKKRTNSTW